MEYHWCEHEGFSSMDSVRMFVLIIKVLFSIGLGNQPTTTSDAIQILSVGGFIMRK